MLRAEEVEIQLMELTQMGVPLGDDPLDGPAQDPTTPTRPTSFRATINGNALTITKQEQAIPSAQATVVRRLMEVSCLISNSLHPFRNRLQHPVYMYCISRPQAVHWLDNL